MLSHLLFIQLNAQLDCSRKLLKLTLKCSYVFRFNNHHQSEETLLRTRKQSLSRGASQSAVRRR